MTESNKKPSFFKSDRNKFIAAAAGAVLLIGGSFGVQAVASSKPFQHLQLAASDTSAYSASFEKASWRGGWGHGKRGGRFANMSDEELEKFVTRMVKHVAIEIDATEEQQTKIATLVSAVAKDIRPMRKKMRATGKEIHEMLLKDAIDRNALEKLRADRLAEVDLMSKNITNALADVAEILTPEQRKLLDERIEDFRSMRGHRRGWHRG